MRNLLRSLPIGAASAAILVVSIAAEAGITQNIDFLNGSGTTLAANVSAFDWNEAGSGVGVGIGPFGTVQPNGTNFQFLYQSNLVATTGAPTPGGLDVNANGAYDAGKTFQLTIVAKFYETILTTTATPIGGGTTKFSSTFLRDPTQHSIVSIFFGTPTTSPADNTATGAGFDSGTEILRMTIDDGEPGFATLSSFDALVGGLGGGTGQGSAKIHAALHDPSDFVNTNYLVGLSDFIFDAEFQSNLNFPPGTSNTSSFHNENEPDPLYPVHAVASNDLLLKVDGQNQFTFVPEPGSLLLVGASLLGLGITARRRRGM